MMLVTVLVCVLSMAALIETASSNVYMEYFNCAICRNGNSDILRIGVSYVTCIGECKARAWCTGVSYRPSGKLCLVHGSDAEQKDWNVCRGYVYSGKIRWRESTIDCNHNSCGQNKTKCATITGTCEYTDCPVPAQSKSSDLILYGNMRTTGANIAYRCAGSLVLSGDSQLSCQNRGNWNHPFPSCGTVSTLTPGASTRTTTVNDIQTSTEQMIASTHTTANSSAETNTPAGIPTTTQHETPSTSNEPKSSSEQSYTTKVQCTDTASELPSSVSRTSSIQLHKADSTTRQFSSTSQQSTTHNHVDDTTTQQITAKDQPPTTQHPIFDIATVKTTVTATSHHTTTQHHIDDITTQQKAVTDQPTKSDFSRR